MSKLSNLRLKLSLLVLVAFIASCAHRIQDEVTQTNDQGEEVHVDKINNSIRVDGIDAKPSKKVRKKPQFDWPVWEARMTRGYLPRGKGRRKRPHKGIDLAAPRGSAVMAAHDGTIIYTGSGFKGYGKMIMIESNDGWATLYGHLDKIVVYEGKKIRQGEVIGALGNTGRSSGPHLHFEIRQLNGPVDPLPLLPAGAALTNDVDNGAVEE
ncbi:MAG: M23 family metallopeptidase [Bdellovibrionaceae bacterium]|nr:M23 family metallopeptidase [Bdellovibrio sp.]